MLVKIRLSTGDIRNYPVRGSVPHPPSFSGCHCRYIRLRSQRLPGSRCLTACHSSFTVNLGNSSGHGAITSPDGSPICRAKISGTTATMSVPDKIEPSEPKLGTDSTASRVTPALCSQLVVLLWPVPAASMDTYLISRNLFGYATIFRAVAESRDRHTYFCVNNVRWKKPVIRRG